MNSILLHLNVTLLLYILERGIFEKEFYVFLTASPLACL